MSSENAQILQTLKGIQTLLTDLNNKMDGLVSSLQNLVVRSSTLSSMNTEEHDDSLPAIETKEDLLQEIVHLTSTALASLPEYLQVTALALNELMTATSNEVSDKTQKERGIESSYLNQLYKRGNLNKFRIGRRIFFTIQNRAQTSQILRLPREAQEPAVILLRSKNPLSKIELEQKLISEFSLSPKQAQKTIRKGLDILESYGMLEKEKSSKPKTELFSLSFKNVETEET